MSILSQLFTKKKRYAVADSQQDNVSNAINPYAGINNISALQRLGIVSGSSEVTEVSALSVPAVYACVRLIAGNISTMPFRIFERRDGVSYQVKNHNYWYLLNEQPHENYSSATFWESFVASILLQGDGFARIIRSNSYSNQVVSLDWLHPSRVTPFWMEDNSVAYRVTELNGDYTGVLAADMIHVPGLGFDGLRGLSPIQYSLKTTASIALSTQNHVSTFFENGTRPDYQITYPEQVKLSAEDIQNLRQQIEENHRGVSKSYRPIVMARGGKIEPLVLSNADAQTLETRHFQASDIARIFGVAPHLIGAENGASTWGTGVEAMNTAHVMHTLLPIMVKIEHEINRKFWPISMKYHGKFDASGLVRGDYQTRINAYRMALGRAGEPAFMSINEVRESEGLPPIDGGDKLIEFKQENNDKSKF